MNKRFIFTVDDNIRFLKELTNGGCGSLFSHPYMAMYKRLHKMFGLKVQLNLFYRCEDFALSAMSDKFISEWKENSDWLKLSFHSKMENHRPYENSDYSEVYKDCAATNREIIRFAGADSLAKTTTIHYCVATNDGLRALSDCKLAGLLGLFGTPDEPRTSYGLEEHNAEKIRCGDTVFESGIFFSGIDIVLNNFETEEILNQLDKLKQRNTVKVMIHEQYFYSDYPAYQKDFEQKLFATFSKLSEDGRKSMFFEEITKK